MNAKNYEIFDYFYGLAVFKLTSGRYVTVREADQNGIRVVKPIRARGGDWRHDYENGEWWIKGNHATALAFAETVYRS